MSPDVSMATVAAAASRCNVSYSSLDCAELLPLTASVLSEVSSAVDGGDVALNAIHVHH